MCHGTQASFQMGLGQMLRITVVDGDALKLLPSCTSTPAWETNNHASGIRKSVRQGVVSPQSPSTGLHCDTDVQRTEGEVVGQPNQRSEDRFRHMANERVRVPQVHPVKRKHSFECGLTLEERRERAQSRSNMRRPTVFSVPQSPTSSWSPTPSPTGHLPCHVYPTPPIDEPLDLIKKPRKEPERTEEKTKSTAAINQMRPSVITCVSSTRKPTCRSEVGSSSHSSTVLSKHSYDHVVEEHFKRSLGMDYQMASSRQLSISVSVDDHFAKALGEKWFQIKSKSSSCSSSTSSPPSSPSFTYSPSYGHSPNQAPKESPSTTTPTSSFWSVK